MVDYSEIRVRIDEFLQTRKGLSKPKNSAAYTLFVREVTGLFCGAAHENNLDTQDVVTFLTAVQDHKIGNIVDDGKLHDVSDLIDPAIVAQPLYNLVELSLMNYKPGNAQIGPGEFFMCFYDRDSVFGIDNSAGYDIITDDTTTELKKIGSNFTTPELFEKYEADPRLARLMGIKPVSDAKKPRKRSQYVCATFSKMDWRTVFRHEPKKADKEGKIEYKLCLV